MNTQIKKYLSGKVIVSRRFDCTGLNLFGFIFMWYKSDSIFRKIFRSYLFKSK